MNFLFSSSSFLPASNIYWKKIRNESTSLDFSEYGNIVHSLLSLENFDSLIATVFFEDIYNSKNQNATELILKALKQALILGKPIYFSIGHNFSKNYITSARYQDHENQQYNFFKENLYQLSLNNNNLFIIDLDKAFALHGHKNIYDMRNRYFSHMRISHEGINIIDNLVSDVIKRSISACKKVLILDCDNTLWGGVIGEDELGGIAIGGDGLGHAFKDFQLIVKTLKDTGILLALASKNEEKDVWNVFDNHNEMILKKEDIVISKINWLEKSENIKQISDELGLGLDSFVFWDDNPIEREKVKNSLPDVTVIEAPKEVFEWPEILSNLNEFSRFQITAEDAQKLEQYKSRAKFNKTKSDINFDQKEFLKQINLKPFMLSIDNSSLSRSAQLTQKTNQFNLRTQRYTETELQEMLNSNDHQCFIFSAVDDFGDHGQIGLSLIKYNYDNKSAFLDTFLLSCRILGRDIELWMMQSILNKLNKDGITILEIEYLETQRNGLVRSFLSECDSNFEKLYSSGKKIRLSTCDTIIDVHKMYSKKI
jgi:FkbH-like protein